MPDPNAPQSAPGPVPQPQSASRAPTAAPTPPDVPSARNPREPMNEEIFYDGPVSWWARTGEIASSIFMAAVFVLAAILIAVWLETWRPWPTVVLAVAAMVPPLLVYLRHINTRYKLTSYRVDFERGIIGRRIDSIELWHIDDICFRQPLLQRIAGVGTLELRSDDRSNPTLVIPALPEGRRLYETLKSRIIAAKRERGLLEVDQ